jgi:hypothetical protein
MFSYLKSAFGPNPQLIPAVLPTRAACVAQPAGATAQRFMGAHPCSEVESDPLSESDPIGGYPDPNLLSYPLRQPFKPILSPFWFLLNLHEIVFDLNSESVRIFTIYDSVQKSLYIVPVLWWILIRNSRNPSHRVKLTVASVCRHPCRINHPGRITEDSRHLWCLHLHQRSTGACRRQRPKPTEPPHCCQPPPLSAVIPRWVNRVPCVTTMP